MISAWWLLLIIPVSATLGTLFAALILAGSEIESRKEREKDETD